MNEGEKRVLFIGDPVYVKAAIVPRVERLKGSKLAHEVASFSEEAERILGGGRITHVVMFNLYHTETNHPAPLEGPYAMVSVDELVEESKLPSILVTPDSRLKKYAPGRCVVLPRRNKRGIEILPAHVYDIPEEQAREIVSLLN